MTNAETTFTIIPNHNHTQWSIEYIRTNGSFGLTGFETSLREAVTVALRFNGEIIVKPYNQPRWKKGHALH